jgi:hypothetical protein
MVSIMYYQIMMFSSTQFQVKVLLQLVLFLLPIARTKDGFGQPLYSLIKTLVKNIV